MLDLQSRGQVLRLDPAAGGRAVSWRVDGHELLDHARVNPVEYGMYAMGPWAGRILDNRVAFADRTVEMPTTYQQWALHGTLLDRAVDVVDVGPAHAIVETRLDDPWPWAGVIRQHWVLVDDALHADIEVVADDEAFPAVVGWHPWFVRGLGVGSPAQWSLPGARLAERGDEYTLTGRLTNLNPDDGPFDDAFSVPGRTASIEWPDALRIDVTSSHDWFVVYDGWPPTICVEPQTGPPNGVNASPLAPLSVVTPEQPLRLRTQWSITRGRLLG